MHSICVLLVVVGGGGGGGGIGGGGDGGGGGGGGSGGVRPLTEVVTRHRQNILPGSMAGYKSRWSCRTTEDKISQVRSGIMHDMYSLHSFRRKSYIGGTICTPT